MPDFRRPVCILLWLWVLVRGPALTAGAPPAVDLCALLARDIVGKQDSFLAGNHLYYVGGQSDVTWRTREHETLGFTHPMFRDGRARGHGIATGKGGTGHDKWGWEFWRRTRAAYGTVIVDGKRFEHPVPREMVWRPDRQTCRYEVGDVEIRETKFISRDDVLCSVIRSSKPVTLEFRGQSFVHTGTVPTFDGDPPDTPFQRERTATGRYDREHNAIHVVEGGTIMVKPAWKTPAVEGKLMYDGMSVVLSASKDLRDAHTIERDAEGRQVYTFRVACAAGEDLVLAFAMGDEYAATVARVRKLLAAARDALDAKTKHMNDLLNRQIPAFRCSDPDAVKTYYYLWAIYFMYFTHTGQGYEAYPHTQTAVNNFMGLHLWDSWVYTAMGSWVADRRQWGYGNILSWKFMVPFKNRENGLPDNFGIAWHSPGVWMNLVGAVEPAWDMYRMSGDRDFLATVYGELFRPLYWDNAGPQRSMGIELNALACLVRMAKALGRDEDVPHWEAMHPGMKRAFEAPWGKYAPDFYAPRGEPWKDIWHLASMMCRDMPQEWVDAQCDRWVMNTETGFLGPVALRIRPPNCPPNGVFAVSTISTWLTVEGMFRHHRDWDAVLCTLNHVRAMNRDKGHPVAPECWDPDGRPWGSQYYNWDGAVTDLLLRRLAGISCSIPDQTFTVSDHLPETWDFVETWVPVGDEWVHTRVERERADDGVRKTVSVRGCPLKTLVVEPWLEDRKLLSASEEARSGAGRGHRRFVFENTRDKTVALRLGKDTVPRRTLADVAPKARTFLDSITVTVRNLEPASRLRFTTDGQEPDRDSPLVEGPISLMRTTALKLRAFPASGAPRTTMALPFTKATLLPARTPKKLEPGLRYERFEGDWQRIPDMDALTAEATGVAADLDVARLGGRKEHFALRLTGFIRVPADGLYTFHLRSDDGSRLRIDGQTVAELNVLCARDAWKTEGMVALQKGLHEVVLEYFQARNHRILQLSYSVDGGPVAPVSPSMLFHAGVAARSSGSPCPPSPRAASARPAPSTKGSWPAWSRSRFLPPTKRATRA